MISCDVMIHMSKKEFC